MVDELTRLGLEKTIEDRASAVDVTKIDAAWLDDPEWYAFQEAFYAVVHYYAEQGDTVIGPLALGGYADFTRLLRKILLSNQLAVHRREQVDEALLSLEGWMDEIRKETMTNLRYHHPDLGI